LLKYNVLLAVLIVGLPNTFVSAQEPPPSIEKVRANASAYKGKTLVFDNVKVSGDLSKKEKFSLLNVKTTAGTTIPATFHVDGLTFTASPNLAANLEKETLPENEYSAKLTCYIKPRGAQAKQWFAEVMQVDLYDRDGKVRKSIDATPPGKDEDIKKDGISGKWKGQRTNDFQGLVGEDWLYVKELKDGKLVGEWAGHTIKSGVRLTDTELIWETDGSDENMRYRARCKLGGDGKELVISYTFYYKQGGTEKSYDGTSHLVRELVGKLTPKAEVLKGVIDPTILVPATLKPIALKNVMDAPLKYEDATFIIDRVMISGEIMKQQAHPGYVMKVDMGDKKYVYKLGKDWNALVVSASMGKEMKNGVSALGAPLGDYMVRLTCKLERGNNWQIRVQQIEFYDEQEKITKSIK